MKSQLRSSSEKNVQGNDSSSVGKANKPVISPKLGKVNAFT
ncbi:MAG: hypothetical protein RID09_18970 [Coleofasciculus sp. G1-WW12-02]